MTRRRSTYPTEAPDALQTLLRPNDAEIPLFAKQSTHSILAGDYIGDNKRQDALYEAFCESVEPIKMVEWRYSNMIFTRSRRSADLGLDADA
jgi:hypothetical protein